MNKIKEMLDYDEQIAQTGQGDVRIRSITCLILGGFSLMLTVLNIGKGYTFMAFTTAFLAVMIFLAGIMYRVSDRRLISNTIVAAACTVIMTYYAVSGANEGFAILWITGVPLLSMMWMGLRVGFAVSMYFQMLLVGLFYTGFREQMGAHYSDIFMIRYPVLYMTIFVTSTWMYYQKLVSRKISEDAGRRDVITGICNRLGFNEFMDDYLKSGDRKPVSTLVFDINRLKFVNDEHGHRAGDEMILAAAGIIGECYPEALIYSRVGGDEFYMVIAGAPGDLEDKRRLLYDKCTGWKGELAPFLSLSCGFAIGEVDDGDSLDALLSEADRDMYREKSEYYKKNKIDRRRS